MEGIIFSHITKAPIVKENKKNPKWNHKYATKNFDYTTIADRIRTASWKSSSHPTGVDKPT